MKHLRTCCSILFGGILLSGCTQNPGVSSLTNTSAHNQTAGNTEPKELNLPPKKSLVFSVEGEKQVVEAILYRSTNQPFTMYVLSTYHASAEGPDKDVVIFKDNVNAAMSIKVFSKTTSVANIERTAKLQLQVTGTPKLEEETSAQLPKGARVYHAVGTQTTAMAVVFIKNGVPFLATVVVPKEFESLSPFFAMLQTALPA